MVIKVGDVAPDFTLRDQNNEQVRLSDFRGHKAVLVIFYPLAFTGICTGELIAAQAATGSSLRCWLRRDQTRSGPADPGLPDRPASTSMCWR